MSTSPMALPKDVCDTVYATTGYEASIKTFARFTKLSDDDIFGDSTDQTATVTGDVTNGYLVTFEYAVDPATAQSADTGGGSGGPGGMGGGPAGGAAPPTAGS